MLLIALANFFNAIADTSTDGLVVDTTPPEKSSSAHSVCWGSKFVGYLIASILVGFIVELFSWSTFFILGFRIKYQRCGNRHVVRKCRLLVRMSHFRTVVGQAFP
ncbi:MAG: hypothetical protein ACTSYC_00995 [Promethearchaeota archaeon]